MEQRQSSGTYGASVSGRNRSMVYISSEGSLSDTRKRKWGLSIIRDLIVGVFDFVGLFFRTLTASPSALENERVSNMVACVSI